MNKLFILLITLLILSCEKEKISSYNPALGNWIIYPETIETAFPSLGLGGEVAFDTSSLMIDGIGVFEPTYQDHKTYLNSDYLSTKSPNILELSVDNLPDGAYKMVYRTCEIDFTQIEALTLSIHAEILNPKQVIEDDEMSVVVRLCSDTSIFYDYFEIERPVLITPDSSSQLSEQWPDENYINKKITDLESLAFRRNELMDNYLIMENRLYIETDNNLKIRQKILGNPDLSNISTICIGIKNPGDHLSTGSNDGLDKSIKVWIY